MLVLTLGNTSACCGGWWQEKVGASQAQISALQAACGQAQVALQEANARCQRLESEHKGSVSQLTHKLTAQKADANYLRQRIKQQTEAQHRERELLEKEKENLEQQMKSKIELCVGEAFSMALGPT